MPAAAVEREVRSCGFELREGERRESYVGVFKSERRERERLNESNNNKE